MSQGAVNRAVRRLPAPLKAAVKQARHGVDAPLEWSYRRRTGDRQPFPPSPIRARSGSPSFTAYAEGGRSHARSLVDALASIGRPIDSFARVLDWGASSGRVLHHLAAAAPEASFTGTDVDAEAIAWARDHRPEARWTVNASRPPTSFRDAEFDLVYSVSVLTHVDEDLQDAWLAELARVLEGGGIALLSFQGAAAYEDCRAGRHVSNSASCARRISYHGALDREGFVHEPYDDNLWNRRAFPDITESFGMTFHSHDYVRSRWGRRFEVLRLMPCTVGDWHDLAVMRRP